MRDGRIAELGAIGLVRVFCEWRAVQNLVETSPEDAAGFLGALQREQSIADQIEGLRAETGLDWDIKWFVRATNGQVEHNKYRYDRLEAQFVDLFGKMPCAGEPSHAESAFYITPSLDSNTRARPGPERL